MSMKNMGNFLFILLTGALMITSSRSSNLPLGSRPDYYDTEMEDKGDRNVLDFVPHEIDELAPERVETEAVKAASPNVTAAAKEGSKDLKTVEGEEKTEESQDYGEILLLNKTKSHDAKEKLEALKAALAKNATIDAAKRDLLKAKLSSDPDDLGNWMALETAKKSHETTDKAKLLQRLRDELRMESKVASVHDSLAKKGLDPKKEEDILELREAMERKKKALARATLESSQSPLALKAAAAAKTAKAAALVQELEKGQVSAVPINYRLKGIPDFITPELFAALYDAGEGDTIALTTLSFPISSVAKLPGMKVIRLTTVPAHIVLEEIMKLIKLEVNDEGVIMLDSSLTPAAKNFPEMKEKEDSIKAIIEKHDGRKYKYQKMDLEKFKILAQKATAVIQTAEPCPAFNLILTKGLMLPTDDVYGGKATGEV